MVTLDLVTHKLDDRVSDFGDREFGSVLVICIQSRVRIHFLIHNDVYFVIQLLDNIVIIKIVGISYKGSRTNRYKLVQTGSNWSRRTKILYQNSRTYPRPSHPFQQRRHQYFCHHHRHRHHPLIFSNCHSMTRKIKRDRTVLENQNQNNYQSKVAGDKLHESGRFLWTVYFIHPLSRRNY